MVVVGVAGCGGLGFGRVEDQRGEDAAGGDGDDGVF